MDAPGTAYVRAHPELRYMLCLFVAEVLHSQPADIRDFAAHFFGSRQVHLFVREHCPSPLPTPEPPESPVEEVSHPLASELLSFCEQFGTPQSDEQVSHTWKALDEALSTSPLEVLDAIEASIQASIDAPKKKVALCLLTRVREQRVTHRETESMLSSRGSFPNTPEAVPIDDFALRPLSALPSKVTFKLDLKELEAVYTYEREALEKVHLTAGTEVQVDLPEHLVSASPEEDPINISIGDEMKAEISLSSSTSSSQGLLLADLVTSDAPASDFTEVHSMTCSWLSTLTCSALEPLPKRVPTIIIQQTLGHFLACPLLGALTQSLRNQFHYPFVISRGGLLNWSVYFPQADIDDNSPLVLTLRSLAPHVSGVGVEEAEFGMDNVSKVLPETYFVCANLEVPGAKCTDAPSVEKLGKVSLIRTSQAQYGDKVYRYIPIVMTVSLNGKTEDLCLILTSFLPTTYFNSIQAPSNVRVVTKALAGSFYKTIHKEVLTTLTQLNLRVTVIRYALLSPTHCFGQSEVIRETGGNLFANSWLNSMIPPPEAVPFFYTQHVVRCHKFLEQKYNSQKYVEQLAEPYDHFAATAVDFSVAYVLTTAELVEERRTDGDFSACPDEAIGWPYIRLMHPPCVSKAAFTSSPALMAYISMFNDHVYPCLWVVEKGLIPERVLMSKLLCQLGPSSYPLTFSKTVHTSIASYLCHKIRDSAAHCLPRLVDMDTDDENGDGNEGVWVTLATETLIKAQLSERRLDVFNIFVVACLSSRVVAGSAPAFEYCDVHHSSMACRPRCSMKLLAGRYRGMRGVIYGENTVAGLVTTFPSLFSPDARLYAGTVVLADLFEALYRSYSCISGGIVISVHPQSDVLPYLAGIGLFYGRTKEESFLFNSAKVQRDTIDSLKYTLENNQINLEDEGNRRELSRDMLICRVRRYKLTSEELQSSVPIIIDEVTRTAPYGLARCLPPLLVRWTPITVMDMDPEFNISNSEMHTSTVSNRVTHLSAGQALVYHHCIKDNGGLELGTVTLEDYTRRAMYSLPTSVVHEVLGNGLHFFSEASGYI
ncbi:hypothetical protein GMRT_15170 [Giardia muris]|uniref:Uncharacterized protein n=1 Tax=Giardia muris TaxID=5742 RepID=A0A4Z1SQK2_GIAMU|nr:hypothetical protein GMRT_15170 [Giardia muris]|eukprot:TNJ28106.1 hypothetical protein GMRT_15170 [Giardia muris]